MESGNPCNIAKYLTNQTELDLSGDEIDYRDMDTLMFTLCFRLNMQSLNLSGSLIRKCWISLMKPHYLTKINIDECDIDDDDVVEMSKWLKRNRTLKKLSIASNHITNAVDQLFGNNLTHLNISDNKIATFNNIKFNGLVKLIMWGCEITPDMVVMIANELRTNTSMVKLDLYNNCIKLDGATAIADALLVNTTLKSLYLCDASWTPMEVICKAMLVNRSLENLMLGYCLTETGLAEMIQNTVLLNLKIFTLIPITKELVAAIKRNTVTSINYPEYVRYLGKKVKKFMRVRLTEKKYCN